jgi:hypothetical protein
VDEDGDDGEEGGTTAATVPLRTKNELLEPDLLVPPIAQVGAEEQLEKVGEIMNIVNNVVIVKGEASATHRTSERALDSETLLVYEDRKVLGYVSSTLHIPTLTDFPTFHYPDTRDLWANISAHVSSQVQQFIPVRSERGAGVATHISCPYAQ